MSGGTFRLFQAAVARLVVGLIGWASVTSGAGHAMARNPASGIVADTAVNGYVVEKGSHPWTGRLRAIRFHTAQGSAATNLEPDLWEAGAVLGRMSTDARRVFTSASAGTGSGAQLVPLHWEALPDELRDIARSAAIGGGGGGGGEGNPAGTETAAIRAIAWLRGTGVAKRERDGPRADERERKRGPPSDPLPAMRPRDTPMGNAQDARVTVVPAVRPTTIWLGTSDGLLHVFDAIDGEERLAWLPPGLLGAAIKGAFPGTRVPGPPCPRPEAVDVLIGGQWHTRVLCGIDAIGKTVQNAALAVGRPSPDTRSAPGADPGETFPVNVNVTADASADAKVDARAGASIAIFDMDNADTSVNGAPAIRLVGELRASAALPLAPAGPVRMARLGGSHAGTPGWHVVVPTAAPDTTRHALALIPVGASSFFSSHYDGADAVRLPLPAEGCEATGSRRLRAVTLLADESQPGQATAAYAVDEAGSLWRFDLRDLPPRGEAVGRAACLYRAGTGTDDAAPFSGTTGDMQEHANRNGSKNNLENNGQGGTESANEDRVHDADPPPDAAGVEPPWLIGAGGGQLVVYGNDNVIAAIPDGFDADIDGRQQPLVRFPAQSGRIPSCALRTIRATPAHDDVALRADPGACADSDIATAFRGWRLALPKRQERLTRILGLDAGYLAFTTRTPDGKQYGYVVDALTGETRHRGPGTATGQLLGGDGAFVLPLVRSPMSGNRPPTPGLSTRENTALSIRAVDGNGVRGTPALEVSRRTGRLGWRELNALPRALPGATSESGSPSARPTTRPVL